MAYTVRAIVVSGAREHNLKNITVSIPKNTFTVITGPSGSGKSSLALDVLYAEGKRRYLESLGSYARQFLGMPQKPDVDRIDGLCPAIAIEQKTVGSNPRSTVGTITELYDYVRVLFARVGVPHCVSCDIPLQTLTPAMVGDEVIRAYEGLTIRIEAPVVQDKKGTFAQELEKWMSQGWRNFVIDEETVRLADSAALSRIALKKSYKHTIHVVVDTVTVEQDELSRVREAVEKALDLAEGLVVVRAGEEERMFSTRAACLTCKQGVMEIGPRLFSFNSPIGACRTCLGLGIDPMYARMIGDELIDITPPCPSCEGKRLNPIALGVKIGGRSIYDWCELPIEQALPELARLPLSEHQVSIVESLLQEIKRRYEFLLDVGLGYLTLNRTARTLSGGEGQRIRLATQIGAGLSGVLYVLDEPSIGLHQRDNDKLIATLRRLTDQGNTVLVVEHDTDTMRAADYIIDMGPGAGAQGGSIIAQGTPQELMDNPESLSGAYLSGRMRIERTHPVRTPTGYITLEHAQAHNLRDITVQFPLGVLCGVSGVSGSGKSSLVMDELVPNLMRAYALKGRSHELGKVRGIEQLDHLVVIDQSPIGRTPRSNPATYLGIFDDIRKLFASVPESNVRGYTLSHFSFNTGPGRCLTCGGEGYVTVSMHFLPDVVVVCDQCKGARYQRPILEIMYKGKNIAQILEMTAQEAYEFFKHFSPLEKRLKIMCEVGLSYLKLGQSALTLSGGEAQRIKLIDELAKRGKKTLYVLDEPTTGLHSHDIKKLLGVFERLIAKGNSMLVIEHNLDVLKVCDYLIDMGPEGGARGGQVIASGTPQQVAQVPASHTGRYLKKIL